MPNLYDFAYEQLCGGDSRLVACATAAITLFTGEKPEIIRFWAEWDEHTLEFNPTQSSGWIFETI